LAFLAAAFTYLTAAIIVPAAAKELETECKELAPELWDEYLAKLEPGQEMAQRPDLMQELADKVQPLIDEKLQKQFAEAKAEGIDVSQEEADWKALDVLKEPVPPPPTKEEALVVDVSALEDQWDEDDDDEIVNKKK